MVYSIMTTCILSYHEDLVVNQTLPHQKVQPIDW